MSAISATIARIAIPNSTLAREAIEFVRDACTQLRTGALLADGVMKRRLPLVAETESRSDGSAPRAKEYT